MPVVAFFIRIKSAKLTVHFFLMLFAVIGELTLIATHKGRFVNIIELGFGELRHYLPPNSERINSFASR